MVRAWCGTFLMFPGILPAEEALLKRKRWFLEATGWFLLLLGGFWVVVLFPGHFLGASRWLLVIPGSFWIAAVTGKDSQGGLLTHGHKLRMDPVLGLSGQIHISDISETKLHGLPLHMTREL